MVKETKQNDLNRKIKEQLWTGYFKYNTKVTILANYNRLELQNEPIGTPSNRRQAKENACDQVTSGFRLRKLRKLRGQKGVQHGKPKAISVTFNTQLTTVLTLPLCRNSVIQSHQGKKVLRRCKQ